jgi:thiol-disulfide isomerase/thioredoxin
VRKVLIDAAGRLARLSAICLLAACGPRAGGGDASEAIPATIEIVGFDALETALVDLRGEGMLLNFWAMWCAPCVAELPELLETAHAFRERGGRVVGVSYDLMVAGADPTTIEDELRVFLDKRGLDYPILVYDEDDYEAVNARYDLGGEIPITLAIDAQGRIVDQQRGRANRERFDEMMRKALGN